MKRYDFNTGWTCRPLSREGDALPVTLPHDAMRSERRVPTSLGEGNIGWFEGGDYEYRKVFSIPDHLQGQSLILEFESVYHNAEVQLNGKTIAFRPYGYTNFYVNLSPCLRSGENELIVIAHNSDQPNSRWYSGTGIYRPVWLWAAKEKHVLLNGVRIETLSISPARIRVGIKTSLPGAVSLEILDGAERVASVALEADSSGNAVAELTVPDAKLWSPETPDLYTVRVTFGDDVVEEHFGIRTLAWTPDKGMAINGNRVVLRGACIHHDNGILGACTYPEVEERRIRILQKAGYNAVRS
ncbi:MAG: glycoside hydrolase family 2, partial [Oscillospiraceae bacterium]|nr:glycoside hydrolase family 2 [Oscillospiraceae bacterium]